MPRSLPSPSQPGRRSLPDSRIEIAEVGVNDEIEDSVVDEDTTPVAGRPLLAGLGLSGGVKRRKIPNDSPPGSQGHEDSSQYDPSTPKGPNPTKRRRASPLTETLDRPSRPLQSEDPVEAVRNDATFERLSEDEFNERLQSWYASIDAAWLAQGGRPYTQADIEDEQIRARIANGEGGADAVLDESELAMNLGSTNEDLEHDAVDTKAESEDDNLQVTLPLDTRTKRA